MGVHSRTCPGTHTHTQIRSHQKRDADRGEKSQAKDEEAEEERRVAEKAGRRGARGENRRDMERVTEGQVK